MNALDRAIKEAGGLTALGKLLGTTPQNIHNWRLRKRVPPKHALAIVKATGGAVTCRELCPDMRGTFRR
jgi:DNA-binding transcriptional regulator YdaS (Cro superfamily)